MLPRYELITTHHRYFNFLTFCGIFPWPINENSFHMLLLAHAVSLVLTIEMLAISFQAPSTKFNESC